MANLFNFYQGAPFGTGLSYPVTYLDFFTGIYFPPSLAQGQTVGFLWEGMGQKIVNQDLTISGAQLDSKKDIVGLGLGFFGYVSPLVKESGVMGLRFTGTLPADSIDRTVFAIRFNGSGLADNKEAATIGATLQSGQFSSDNHDVLTFGVPIKSGVMTQDTYKVVSFATSFYGNFYPKSIPEAASINVHISSVDYDTTAFRTIVRAGTGASIYFRITDVFYETAV